MQRLGASVSSKSHHKLYVIDTTSTPVLEIRSWEYYINYQLLSFIELKLKDLFDIYVILND